MGFTSFNPSHDLAAGLHVMRNYRCAFLASGCRFFTVMQTKSQQHLETNFRVAG
jgi:hypothetical protein